LDDGIERCLLCSKISFRAAGTIIPPSTSEKERIEPGPPSAQPKSQDRETSPAGDALDVDLLDEKTAVAIAEEIRQIRQIFGISHDTIEVEDEIVGIHFSEEWKESLKTDIEKVLPLGEDESIENRTAAYKALEAAASEKFFLAFRDSAKAALLAFSSSPESLEFHSKHLEFNTELKVMGHALLAAIQADRLRRKYGLGEDWPAEMAILFGTSAVPPPRRGVLRKRLAKESLANQLGKLLFESVPVPLDDPQTVQVHRDAFHEVIEQILQTHRQRRRSGSMGPLYHQQPDGTMVPVPPENEEILMYKLIQDHLPKYLSQPLPATAIPKRVLDQRLRDAAERRRRLPPYPEDSLLLTVPGQRRARRKRKK
jgi:hypothetical protein